MKIQVACFIEKNFCNFLDFYNSVKLMKKISKNLKFPKNSQTITLSVVFSSFRMKFIKLFVVSHKNFEYSTTKKEKKGVLQC